MNRNIETFRINWSGISIEIRWEKSWLNLTSGGYDTAHLEIESIAPERAPLPITETGCRSHLTAPETAAGKLYPPAIQRMGSEQSSRSPAFVNV